MRKVTFLSTLQNNVAFSHSLTKKCTYIIKSKEYETEVTELTAEFHPET